MKHIPVWLRFGAYGLAFGFCLERIGFGDFAEVHAMFTFTDLRLFLTFCGAVVLIAVGFAAVARNQFGAPRPLHPGVYWGSALFGIGWATTGACPSIVLVHLGTGRAAALATLAGVFAGAWLYPRLHRRFFAWDTGSCGL